MRETMARRNAARGTIQVSDEVRSILELYIDGCTGNLAPKIERRLSRDEYTKVNEVLVAAGGRWQGTLKVPGRTEKGAHVFPLGSDARALIRAVFESGEVADPKRGDFFPTPDDLAHDMAKLAGCTSGMTVLEPSAGKGPIAAAARIYGATVLVVEEDGERRAHLQARQFQVLPGGINDFLAIPPAPMFDAVVMNPPWSRQQDIAHVTHALKFVKPGGRLVAAMWPAWQTSTFKVAEA